MHKGFLVLSILLVASTAFTAEKTPLGENFCSATCPFCVEEDAAFEACIAAYGLQITTIGLHVNWPSGGDVFYNTSVGGRTGFYTIDGVPDARLDGANIQTPSWAISIPGLLSTPAPISIQLTGSYNPSNHKACLRAQIHCESSMVGTAHRIYFCITEDDLSTLTYHYNRVCRVINSAGLGQSFTIAPGQTKIVSTNLFLDPSWNTSKCKVACWVQSDHATGTEVANSKQILFSNLEVSDVQPSSIGAIKANYR